ncbi:MAG: hypothetical protein II939_00570 [Bacteroidales bacterium]|nr:hypothetical protein [Bacteroidales bacterium]MDD6001090.1 hypothetical protein [Bacteroidales bacterium]
MNGSAFASIMILIIAAFIGGMVFILKKNKSDEEEERPIEKQDLNDFANTIDSISLERGMTFEEKKRRAEEKAAEEKRLQEVKFKSDNPIKEIQARNHMRKSPADEYFERMKLAAAEVIKPKK